jgi:hypothetical protein
MKSMKMKTIFVETRFINSWLSYDEANFTDETFIFSQHKYTFYSLESEMKVMNYLWRRTIHPLSESSVCRNIRRLL